MYIYTYIYFSFFFFFFLALAVAPLWIAPLPTRIFRQPGPCLAHLDPLPSLAGSWGGEWRG